MRPRITLVGMTPEFIHAIPSVNCAPKARGVKHWPISVERYMVEGLPDTLDALILTSDLQGVDRDDVDVSQRRLVGHNVAEHLEELCTRQILPEADRCGVLLAGDLFAIKHLQKRGGLGDVQDVWQAFADRFRWVVGVAGNHDTFADACDLKALEEMDGCHGLDGDVTKLDGVLLGGVSGVIGTTLRPWRRSPEQFSTMLSGVLDASPDIAILHHPPSLPGLPDLGHDAIAACLNERARGLSFVLCGHVHWPAPIRHLEGTHQPLIPVINVDHRVVILQRKLETA